jgi:glycogen(starch) synthase
MKIAFVSFEYPPDTALGGIATYIYQAAHMLVLKGHIVEVFVASPKSGDTTLDNGVIVHKVLTGSRDDFRSLVAKRFFDRHQQVSFDILEGPDYGAEASECIKLAPNIPFTIKLHSPTFLVNEMGKTKVSLVNRIRAFAGALIRMRNPFPEKYNKQSDPEYRHILKADVIVAPSLAIADKVKKGWQLEDRNFDLVPLPYVPSEAYLQIEPATKTNTILYFGRLEQRKGVLDFANAIPSILKKFPETKFRFLGRSLQSPVNGMNMREYISQLLNNYADSIEFINEVNPTEVPKQLAMADICILPSIWESYGFVCLEAMAAARGVIATNSGGMKEILDNGRVGLLVPPNNPGEIAEAAIKLLGNVDMRVRLGKEARARVLNSYDTDTIYKLHIKSYLRTIQEKAEKVKLQSTVR